MYGHMIRRHEEHIVKRVPMTNIAGRKQKGRPKTRWKDACKKGMNTVDLNAVGAINRATGKKKITPATPHERGKKAVEMIIV